MLIMTVMTQESTMPAPTQVITNNQDLIQNLCYHILPEIVSWISYFPLEVFNILQSVTMGCLPACVPADFDIWPEWAWIKQHQMQIIIMIIVIYLPSYVLLGYLPCEVIILNFIFQVAPAGPINLSNRRKGVWRPGTLISSPALWRRSPRSRWCRSG